jgi:hypothetical protein
MSLIRDGDLLASSSDASTRIAELYDATGRATFPTVDPVRRRSKTNMNDASVAMRAWRAEQNSTGQPIAVTIPDAIRSVHNDALGALWNSCAARSIRSRGKTPTCSMRSSQARRCEVQ